MYQESRIIFLYTETSFHPGSGDSIVGVDLPIQRERHTDFPKNQGGGVKGALRDLAETKLQTGGKIDPLVEEIFGQETNDSQPYQGALSPTEMRILLFPVKSLKDVFAWITCPFVIARFQRDLKRLNRNYSELDVVHLDRLADTQALTPAVCYLATASGEIILEDLAFDVDDSKITEVNKLAEWIAKTAFSKNEIANPYEYWEKKLQTSLIVVSDEIFQHFVVNYTEVSTRHKRGETGTVESGALWSEETLPPDTLMYARLLASDSNKDGSELKALEVITTIENVIKDVGFIQMGASETVGQGFLAINCFNPSEQKNDGLIDESNLSSETISETSDPNKGGENDQPTS